MFKRLSPVLVTVVLLVALPTGVSAYANKTPPTFDLATTGCDDAAGSYVLHLFWEPSAGKPTEYQADPDPAFYKISAADLKIGHIDVAMPAAGSYGVQLTNRWGDSIHDVTCP